MKRIKAWLLIAGLLTSLSCDKDLDKLNPNEPTTETYYKTGSQIVTAVNAVYSSWQGNQLVCREYYFVHDLRSDDIQSGGGQLETPRAQLLNGDHDASNAPMVSVWQGLYRVIHQANLVIENAPGATEDVTDELKNRVLGEAKFHRAWAYFELVSLWGGVPLMQEYAKTPDANQPRATEEQIYTLIVQDLKDAAASLPLKSAYSDTEIGRASQGAAQAMLARAYLQQGNYAAAQEQLAAVINSNQYSLENSYIDNFREEKEFNQESIWEISFTEAFGGSNWAGDGSGQNNEVSFRGQEYGPVSWRNVIPSNSLLAEYEKVADGDAKDDPRYSESFYFVGDTYNNEQNTITEMQGADPKISWKKYQKIYKAETENFQSGINHRIIRYAEVLLMMAECENEVGNSPAAIQLMNQVRARPSVSMPPYPTATYPCSNTDEVFAALVHEKRVEHGGEQIRNRDILRWRKSGKLTTEPLSYFTSNKHELLPIPQSEVDNNDQIDASSQNPGY